MPDLRLTHATLDDLPALVPLFDAYRMFYRQPSDPVLARAFLRERLSLRESVIVLARRGNSDEGLGFTQLYPCFSSVAARRLWILNDLFVRTSARRQGVGCALLREAERHAKACAAVRLVLSTEADNLAAQALYESAGWELDRDRIYQRAVGPSGT